MTFLLKSMIKISLETLKAYIDYLYLGNEQFFQKVIKGEFKFSLDVIELFKFAHFLQAPDLVDCCTNLISLDSNLKNKLQEIQELTEIYEKLVEHFNEKNKTIIKN